MCERQHDFSGVPIAQEKIVDPAKHSSIVCGNQACRNAQVYFFAIEITSYFINILFFFTAQVGVLKCLFLPCEGCFEGLTHPKYSLVYPPIAIDLQDKNG